MSKITISAEPLRQILQALLGPGHHIRELQATRSLHALGHPNPIDTLVEEYNAFVEEERKKALNVTGSSDQVPESPGG